MGVADQCRKVADDEHCLVTEVLKLAQLVEHHEVAESQIGACGIHAKLYAQRTVAVHAVFEFGVTNDGIGVAADCVNQAHLERNRDSGRSKVEKQSGE